MRNTRDLKIIEFIETFGAATRSQVQTLFFSSQSQADLIARRVLTRIVKAKVGISRKETLYSADYVYYTKDCQLYHKLLIADCYVKFFTTPGKILTFDNHYTLGGIRPDAYIEFYYNKVYLFFLEVQISANPLNLKKYETLFDSAAFNLPTEPRIIVVSNRKWKVDTRLNYLILPINFTGWSQIFA